jgi:hypothetical protein
VDSGGDQVRCDVAAKAPSGTAATSPLATDAATRDVSLMDNRPRPRIPSPPQRSGGWLILSRAWIRKDNKGMLLEEQINS